MSHDLRRRALWITLLGTGCITLGVPDQVDPPRTEGLVYAARTTYITEVSQDPEGAPSAHLRRAVFNGLRDSRSFSLVKEGVNGTNHLEVKVDRKKSECLCLLVPFVLTAGLFPMRSTTELTVTIRFTRAAADATVTRTATLCNVRQLFMIFAMPFRPFGADAEQTTVANLTAEIVREGQLLGYITNDEACRKEFEEMRRTGWRAAKVDCSPGWQIAFAIGPSMSADLGALPPQDPVARVEQALKIATTWVHFDRMRHAYRDDVRAALNSFHTELGEQLFQSVSLHHQNLRARGMPLSPDQLTQVDGWQKGIAELRSDSPEKALQLDECANVLKQILEFHKQQKAKTAADPKAGKNGEKK